MRIFSSKYFYISVYLRLINFREWGQLLPTAKTGKSSFCTVRILRVPNVGPATLPKLLPTPGKEKFKIVCPFFKIKDS